MQSGSGASAAFGKRGAELRVGGDAADDRDAVGARRLDPLDERAHDRPLVARGQVRAPRCELVVTQLPHGVEQRGLQPREREVEAGDARDREVVRLGIAVAREQVELTPAGIPEAEEARALVERLAGGVVERRSEHGVPGALAHVEQHRVAAAREQARERRL